MSQNLKTHAPFPSTQKYQVRHSQLLVLYPRPVVSIIVEGNNLYILISLDTSTLTAQEDYYSGTSRGGTYSDFLPAGTPSTPVHLHVLCPPRFVFIPPLFIAIKIRLDSPTD